MRVSKTVREEVERNLRCYETSGAADLDRVELEEERQGLADASTSTEDGNLGLTGGRGGELAGLGLESTGGSASEHGVGR